MAGQGDGTTVGGNPVLQTLLNRMMVGVTCLTLPLPCNRVSPLCSYTAAWAKGALATSEFWAAQQIPKDAKGITLLTMHTHRTAGVGTVHSRP